jgi:hypothetical protein
MTIWFTGDSGAGGARGLYSLGGPGVEVTLPAWLALLDRRCIMAVFL